MNPFIVKKCNTFFGNKNNLIVIHQDQSEITEKTEKAYTRLEKRRQGWKSEDKFEKRRQGWNSADKVGNAKASLK